MHTLSNLRARTVSALLCALGAVGGAQAAAVISITEVGSDVMVQGSGSFNLAGLTLLFNNVNSNAMINPAGPAVLVGPNSALADAYRVLSGPGNFGLGGLATATAGTGSGDRFGVTFTGPDLILIVPDDYVTGETLTGENRFNNRNFTNLGVTEGTYVWTWGSGADADSLTLRIGDPHGVPVPATLGLLMLGLAGLGACRRGGRRA